MINIQISEEKFRQILKEVYEMGRQDEQTSSDYFKGYSRGYSDGYSSGWLQGYSSHPSQFIDTTPFICNTNQLTATNTILTVSCDGTCEVTTTDSYNSLDSAKIRG